MPLKKSKPITFKDFITLSIGSKNFKWSSFYKLLSIHIEALRKLNFIMELSSGQWFRETSYNLIIYKSILLKINVS